jgi:hypothetical protein
MDFSRFNQAEQAQIGAMIEHKQVNLQWSRNSSVLIG